MRKLRVRLVNTGEEALDLKEVAEGINSDDHETMAAVSQSDELIVDQDRIQGLIGLDKLEPPENDQGFMFGKIDQRINKARIYRGWIRKHARKHKKVSYTSNGNE